MPSATDRSPFVQRQPSTRRPPTQPPPAKRRRTTPPTPPVHSPSSPSRSVVEPFPIRPESHPASSARWFRKPSVVWYRGNDLRVEDHPALFTAAQRGGPVIPLFIWDRSDGFGAGLGTVKQWWLRQSLQQLQNDLRRLGVQLYTRNGKSTEELRKFLTDTGADAVFWNRCYEPFLLKRDEELREELAHEGFTAESFKAEVLVEPWELTNSETSPRYQTFHAYMTAWMTVAPPPHPLPSPSRLQPISTVVHSVGLDLLGLEIADEVGERLAKIWKPGSAQAKRQLDRFLNDVFPSFGESRCRRHVEGTSRLSPHIRFGEISPRRMYHATKLWVSRWDQALGSRTFLKSQKARKHRPLVSDKPGTDDSNKIRKFGSESPSTPHLSNLNNLTSSSRRSGLDRKHGTSKDHIAQELPVSGKSRALLPRISQSARAFLKNLCLRDFSFHVLYHFPDMETKPLIPEFVKFPWGDDNGLFDRWKHGITGYPIIDAAMRQLRETGWIHNGMRFLLACFLTKYMLLPWARGLGQFYNLLLDGDHSSNALGWQWTAGTYTDAFPVTNLVNPVKLSHKHDPNGQYIRRWLPELAKLPTKYIHQPWKAPPMLLKKCGIIMGDTYPDRVVNSLHAKQRAVKAMTVMKQIFASNTLWKRRFREDNQNLVVEWPELDTEALKQEEFSSGSGKGFLIPSIWALLQGEPSPSYLPGPLTSGESLIPMDTTVCLVDGALAIPMDDQPESIEQALISAHGYVDEDPRLSSGASLSPDNREQQSHCQHQPSAAEEQSGDFFTAVNDKSEEVQPIEEPLKSSAVEQKPCNGKERPSEEYDEDFQHAGNMNESEKPSIQLPVGYNPSSCNMNSPEQAPDQEMMEPRSSQASLRKDTNETRTPEKSAATNRQVPELQNFLRSQNPNASANSTQHTETVTFPSGSPGCSTQLLSSVSSQPMVHLKGTNDIKHSQETPERVQRIEHHSQPALDDQHIAHDFFGVSMTSRQMQVSAAQPSKVSSALYVSQQHLATSMPVELDSAYAPRFSCSQVQVNHIPSTSMPLNPLATNSVSNANDVTSAPVYCTGEGMNSLPPHHNHFYGARQFFPVMNAHAMNPGDQSNLNHPHPAHPQKVALPGVFPLTYGVYGSGFLDHSVYNGHLNHSRFPANVYSSQPHPAAALQTRSQDILPHHTVFQLGPHQDVRQTHASAILQHGQQNPGYAGQDGKQEVNEHISVSPLQSSNRNSSGHLVQESGSSHQTGAPKHGTANPHQPSPIQYHHIPGQAAPLTEAHPATNYQLVNAYCNSSIHSGTGAGALQHAQKNTISGSKPKSTPRAKRVRQNQGSNSRGKRDGKRGSVERLGANGSHSTRDARGRAFADASTTPKNRQNILESVLASEDHEYRGFAQYLSETYEFTGNTNRQTSRDYVRLCNLKDDYHKKCTTEKDKLKIYRIKDFFSKVLKLEVTGEWDRHNHGGVRGPYVYGIKLKQQANSKPN